LAAARLDLGVVHELAAARDQVEQRV